MAGKKNTQYIFAQSCSSRECKKDIKKENPKKLSETVTRPHIKNSAENYVKCMVCGKKTIINKNK